MDWTPGRQFEVVTVSFDPTETPTLAKLKKQNYLAAYGRPEAGPGWHFLVGSPESVHALTEAVGFHYRWDDATEQFAHQAAIYVLTPDGTLSRYLYGVMFEPRTLRLSLVEAAAGGIGSPLDQIILYCFHYDADLGRYSLVALNLVRAGAIVSILVLGSFLSALWIRESRRRKTLTAGQVS
jgi:protein SCO1/2